MKQFIRYLNPIQRLGYPNYSFWFPLLFSLFVAAASEFFAYSILQNPMAVGTYIIFVHVALVIYFSFRDGIKGGAIAAFVAVAYYIYIIISRDYSSAQLTRSIDTIIILGILFMLLAFVIGWLKQRIDRLIDREKDEKRRLEAIISQLPVGIVITDKDGRVQETNKKFEQILGTKIPSGFFVGGKPLLQTSQNGKSMATSQGPLATTLATGKPVIGKEYEIVKKDGKHVYVQSSAAAIHNKAGKIIAAALIANDVTQQKEMEQRKDDFVNMASHELKTPITSMKLYTEALIRRLNSKDESVQKILQRIQYQTENLQELINDLLDVSRIQTGKLSFNKEKFVLNDLIEETVQALQESTAHHKISVHAKRKLTVYADRFRLYQVLTNLITNAIKYSPQGGDIKVTLKVSERKAIVSVQDQGIGIPKDQYRKIFERLYQVTGPKEKTFPGLGMGLYISKEIIRRHRGSIWVESQQGKGTLFYFSIPMKQDK